MGLADVRSDPLVVRSNYARFPRLHSLGPLPWLGVRHCRYWPCCHVLHIRSLQRCSRRSGDHERALLLATPFWLAHASPHRNFPHGVCVRPVAWSSARGAGDARPTWHERGHQTCHARGRITRHQRRRNLDLVPQQQPRVGAQEVLRRDPRASARPGRVLPPDHWCVAVYRHRWRAVCVALSHPLGRHHARHGRRSFAAHAQRWSSRSRQHGQLGHWRFACRPCRRVAVSAVGRVTSVRAHAACV